MTSLETENDAATDSLAEQALVLAEELGLDRSAWYLQSIEGSRSAGQPVSVGALVRTYWELQRVTGRADLCDAWRRLADSLWQGDDA